MTPLVASVPNEGTKKEPFGYDRSAAEIRRFSMIHIVPPLLLITSASVALVGLGPYLRLRHHILRQGGVMQSLRKSIEDGNKLFLEHARAKDAEAVAREVDYQKSRVALQEKIRELEQRYRQVEALSRSHAETLSTMKEAIEKGKARQQEMER